MKKTVTIALASLLAASPVAGIAYAQSAAEPMASDSMSTGSISADQVNVVTLSSLEADKSKTSEFDPSRTVCHPASTGNTSCCLRPKRSRHSIFT